MPRRKGFSLVELIVVMAVILIFGAIVVPTLFGARRDTQVKAGGDIVHSYIARARAKAVEDGKAYRLALSADGKKVQIMPDVDDGTAAEDDETNSGPLHCEESLPEGVTAVIITSDDDYVAQDQTGWQRVATFLPDGTCREEGVEVRVEEKGVQSIIIKLRGITGSSSTTKVSASP
jgi:prepilin-type N-terminal cleavage/methylation domain-containing protein